MATRSNGLIYLECSAKLGLGIEELLTVLAKCCIIADPNDKSLKKLSQLFLVVRRRHEETASMSVSAIGLTHDLRREESA